MFSLLLAENENVVYRFSATDAPIYLSSVAAQERLIGYMSNITCASAPRTSLSLPRAYADLTMALATINRLPILVYSDEAEAVYRTFSPAQIRIGAQDCRIAAQALAHGLTVVTRNLRDFKAIGAPCTDWSV